MKKRDVAVLLLGILIIFIIPLMSAGALQDFFKKLTITGKTESTAVDINITVTSGNAPEIRRVYNITSSIIDGPNEATNTNITINFTVYDAEGDHTIDNSSAKVTVARSGEENRTNFTCAWWAADDSADEVNFTCNITLWWYDGVGDWTIWVNVTDLTSNVGENNTKTFYVGTTDGIENNASSVTFGSISAGATDTQSTNLAYLNNTGNRDEWITVNTTDLIGESTPAYAIGATNFSVNGTGWCQNSAMVRHEARNITDAVFPKGNYSLNDGTAQEILYFCIEEVNADLSPQYYSTLAEGSWTIGLTAQ